MNVAGQSSCTPVKVPDCRLSDDLGSLFDRSLFCDVVLCVGGREFHSHKAVLAGITTLLTRDIGVLGLISWPSSMLC